jgi:hypothetical protein
MQGQRREVTEADREHKREIVQAMIDRKIEDKGLVVWSPADTEALRAALRAEAV